MPKYPDPPSKYDFGKYAPKEKPEPKPDPDPPPEPKDD